MPSRKLNFTRVLHGKAFGPTHDDAVGDDQADEDRQSLADVEHERLQELIDDDHQRGDDRHLHDDADAAGDLRADQGHRRVAQRRDKHHGSAHDQRRLELRRHRQRRADPQHLQRDRIVVEQRVQQDLLGLGSAIVSLPLLSQFAEIRSKSVVAKPIVQQVRHAAGRDRRSGETIDLMHRLGRVRIDASLDHADLDVAAIVEQQLSLPLRFPVGIVDFAAEPGRFAVLVKRQTADRPQVAIDRHKSVQRRPQPHTLDWQHDLLHLARIVS